MAKRKPQADCDKLHDCFDIRTLGKDDKDFGHLEGWEAKSLPLTKSCRDEVNSMKHKKGVKVLTLSNAKGLFIIHCPHPPCH